MTLDEDMQAALDLLALAHSIEPMKWRRLSPGRVDWRSARHGRGCGCPLQHAVRVLTGEKVTAARAAFEAELALDIPWETGKDIVNAADYVAHPRRPALLAVYGITESPS